MDRRNILWGVARLGLAGLLLSPPFARRSALADAREVGDGERILGAAEAPLTIIEYASMTCPHCAEFHKSTLPGVKENWIESGRARLVYRHFPLDGLALRAAALAECLEGDSFFGFIDLLFSTQQTWSRSSDPIAALQNLAKQAGMSAEKSRACLEDDETITRILVQRKEASEAFEITSTPSFVVNGKKLAGVLGYEPFNAFLEDQL